MIAMTPAEERLRAAVQVGDDEPAGPLRLDLGRSPVGRSALRFQAAALRQQLDARAAGLVRPTHRRRDRAVVGLAAVVAVAAAPRLGALLAGGLQAWGRYDDGVHFAAALALVHGSVPYRDVLLLQPPGLVVLLAPFALLAGLVGDAHAFEAARVAFALLGVVNAGLVWAVLRRLVPGPTGALCGGLLFALSGPAVYVEQSTLLEVPGTTAVLLALLLIVGPATRAPGLAVVAGLVAGLGVGVKVWYAVPALVLLGGARGLRLPFLAGATAGVVALHLPFFLLAPDRMWQEVVAAQLGRPRSGADLVVRFDAMLGLDASRAGLGAALLVALGVLAALSLLGRGAGLPVGIAASSVALLLATPSFFQHYAALSAAPLALVAGAGLGRAAALAGPRGRGALVAATAVLALVVNLPALVEPTGRPLPAGLAGATVRLGPCLVADDPTVLVLLDRMSADLGHGCPVQVDPTGAAYVLRPHGADATPPRSRNPRFQRELVAFLRSGDGTVLARGDGLGLSDASRRAIEQDPVGYARDGVVVRVPDRRSR